MSLSNFDFGKKLGKGSFGTVCLVKRKLDGKVYAMKRVYLSNSPKTEIEAALNEIRLLSSLNHPNIIGYKETFYDNPSKTLNIVMEFADGGDLAKRIEYNKKNYCRFDENVIWEWIFQLLYGVKYLHSHQIMHRDLKSANIFLKKDGILKIGDLNVSKLSKNNYARTKTGTPYYLAPEVWQDRPYDYKCDIWSLGCIIYELCTLYPPFRGTNFKELYNNIKEGKFNPIPRDYSNDLRQLINWMLITNPNKRYSANDLLNSDIIQKRIKNNSRKDIIEKISKIDEKGFNMGCTIRMPRNPKDINKVLPHERYQMGENDPYETMKKTIKIMVNTDENSNDKKNNNINIQPLNNYDRRINQQRNNPNNLINNDNNNNNQIYNNQINNNQINNNQINNNQINNNQINNNLINNNLINNNNNIFNNKPIIKEENKNIRKEYGIFNNNNHNNINEPKKIFNNNQSNKKLSNKEIRINNSANSQKNENNSNQLIMKSGMDTKKRKEQKEKFNQIKNEFKGPQSNRINKNMNHQKKQKQNGMKQKRLPSAHPYNNNNNNIMHNEKDKNSNNRNINLNYNKNNNINFNNNNNLNYNYNVNNNNINNNNNYKRNNKRPLSHYNNRIQVKNIQNNNINNQRNYNNNIPIRKYEIKNHNYNFRGQNFDMNPYQKEKKANYGKLDINQYRQNNKIKFNNYLHKGKRGNDYNNQIKAHRERVNPAYNQNHMHKYKK